MRKKIIAGNWKMNLTPREAIEFANSIKSAICTEKADVVLCAPAVSLAQVLEAVAGTRVSVGAQNMHFEDSGAFTGEISAKMLVAMGVSYVIIGHSERREYFAETDENVNKKARKALAQGLTPIICVGETLTQREQGITVDLVRQQTKIAFMEIHAEDAAKCVVAYEPIWAIGTGKTATSQQAEEVCAAIRQVLAEIYSQEVSAQIRIQYGGSVNAKNAAELFSMPNIDGGLVGGASLKPEFADIVASC
ncbi:MAG: triose-phosphate isomerase [Defluviitaleaceae bacterium]|nr:triose-phosphate isomerase [Defluviitaleaceae bacterium]